MHAPILVADRKRLLFESFTDESVSFQIPIGNYSTIDRMIDEARIFMENSREQRTQAEELD